MVSQLRQGAEARRIEQVTVADLPLTSKARAVCTGARTQPGLSHTMYESKGFRESISPQNHDLIVLIRNSKQYVNDFVGKLTFIQTD